MSFKLDCARVLGYVKTCRIQPQWTSSSPTPTKARYSWSRTIASRLTGALATYHHPTAVAKILDGRQSRDRKWNPVYIYLDPVFFLFFLKDVGRLQRLEPHATTRTDSFHFTQNWTHDLPNSLSWQRNCITHYTWCERAKPICPRSGKWDVKRRRKLEKTTSVYLKKQKEKFATQWNLVFVCSEIWNWANHFNDY